MRSKHWYKGLYGLLILLAGSQVASAQYQYGPAEMPDGTYPPPSYSLVPPQQMFSAQMHPTGPYQGQMVGGGNYPSHSDVSTAPYGAMPLQPGTQAWPGISPYDYQFSQYTNMGGLWSHDANNNGRKYFFAMDYLAAKLKGPNNAIVGHEPAQTYLQLFTDEELGEDILVDELEDFQNFIPGTNFFNRVSAGEVMDYVGTSGMQIQWGFENPDESGFLLNGWWLKDNSSIYNAEDEVSGKKLSDADEDLVTEVLGSDVLDLISEEPDDDDEEIELVLAEDIADILERSLMNLNSLSLDDGTRNGSAVPYDLKFKLEYESQAAGTNATWFLTPLVNRRTFRVRPLVGARYTYIREAFRFEGADSGLFYNEFVDLDGDEDDIEFLHFLLKAHPVNDGVDNNNDGIVDNAGVFDEENAGEDVTWGFFPSDIVQAFLNNNSKSNLFGPEIGLQYDLGGNKFMLTGHTKFALLANFERIKMDGDNIGQILDPFYIRGFSTTRGDLFVPTGSNPNPNAFDDAESHSHVSPLIEQSIQAEAYLLKHVPVINKLETFREAKFRAGYTYTAIWEVVDPESSIYWAGNPTAGLFPYISVDRGKWAMGAWNFGLEWNY